MIKVIRIGQNKRTQLLDILKDRGSTVNRKRKHYIAICGELAMEEAMDLS
jgi:hypothetical protein